MSLVTLLRFIFLCDKRVRFFAHPPNASLFIPSRNGTHNQEKHSGIKSKRKPTTPGSTKPAYSLVILVLAGEEVGENRLQLILVLRGVVVLVLPLVVVIVVVITTKCAVATLAACGAAVVAAIAAAIASFAATIGAFAARGPRAVVAAAAVAAAVAAAAAAIAAQDGQSRQASCEAREGRRPRELGRPRRWRAGGGVLNSVSS